MRINKCWVLEKSGVDDDFQIILYYQDPSGDQMKYFLTNV